MQFLLLNTFWLLVVTGTLLAGKSCKRARTFRDKMMRQWKAALTIAIIYLIASIIGTAFNPTMYVAELFGMLGVFCMSLLGTTFAKSTISFEPFPVTQSVIQRHRPWIKVALMIGIALLAVPVAIVLGNIGMAIGHIVFHETIPINSGSSFFPTNKLMAFFQFTVWSWYHRGDALSPGNIVICLDVNWKKMARYPPFCYCFRCLSSITHR
jgi:hypothetical protein